MSADEIVVRRPFIDVEEVLPAWSIPNGATSARRADRGSLRSAAIRPLLGVVVLQLVQSKDVPRLL